MAGTLARAGIAIVLFIILLELFALWRADRRTPGILAEAATGELKLGDLPKRRIAMLLKVEDPDFYAHRGIDLSTPGAGLTTITQALVKRFYFERFEPGLAKIEQSLIARFVLDRAMPKDRQLEAFLNFSYFGEANGRPVIGFAEAARTFYGAELGELDDRQFLSLVAMLMAPNALHPVRNRQANAERVRRVEALLLGKCRPNGLRDVTFEACQAFVR